MNDYSVCIHGDEQFLTVKANSFSGAAIEFVRSQLVCDGEFRYTVVVQDENGRKQKYDVNGLVAKEGEDNIYEEYRAELVYEYNETAPSNFRKYRRIATVAELRPWVPGEDLSNISVSDADVVEVNCGVPGAMIARNPDNHSDQWLIGAEYFAKHFEPNPID